MTIKEVSVKCFKIPTETPEQDGTLEWNSTTLVTVEVATGEKSGLGYTYADEATARFIVEHGVPYVLGQDELANLEIVKKIKRHHRNMGNGGVSAMALSAMDVALWDLKCKTLDVSIQEILGRRRKKTSFYGSGLFINNTEKDLERQLKKFRDLGMRVFKMKIGEGVEQDVARIKKVKALLGSGQELYVDANGRYGASDALALAQELSRMNIGWLEEPVTSDDFPTLGLLRESFPPNVRLAAGEYCYQDWDFQRLIDLVDVLMVDGTRCEGVSGVMAAAELCRSHNVPLSTHCAPLLHGNLGPCLDSEILHECFYDHLRIEERYFCFEGSYADGAYIPSLDQKGFGWRLNPRFTQGAVYEHVIS